jgi:diguanylate cyclase (GGDEF)-like protein
MDPTLSGRVTSLLCEHPIVRTTAGDSDAGSAGERTGFLDTPVRVQVLIVLAVAAALVLPLVLAGRGRVVIAHQPVLTALLLVILAALNVELGRSFEGGLVDSQRPHKALSAWAFATALLLPLPYLLPVVAISYAHARWRGLRVALWKWVGSAAYLVLAGVAAAMAAVAVTGESSNLMRGDGAAGLGAVVAAAATFLAVETLLFHASAYLNHVDDERWLRRTLRGRSFYFTEASVLLLGGLFAAIWTGGPWFVLLVVPVYGLAQRAALHDSLREQAEVDDKTGLLRFESWRRLAVAARQRCVARDQPWSVAFIDLDHFKRYNDAHGHLVGDEALLAVAETLRGQLRDDDLLARFGGEEFCLFLPSTPYDEATAIAERLRQAVAAATMPGSVEHVTVSVGVAGVARDRLDLELVDTMTQADQALFEAKALGRNRVCVRSYVAGDPTSPEAEAAWVRPPERSG